METGNMAGASLHTSLDAFSMPDSTEFRILRIPHILEHTRGDYAPELQMAQTGVMPRSKKWVDRSQDLVDQFRGCTEKAW